MFEKNIVKGNSNYPAEEQKKFINNEFSSTLKKPWPQDCPWPEPVEWSFDYDEDMIPDAHDEETDELLEIREYFDGLVENGVLNEDYTLNEDYETDKEEENDFYPELGTDYWDDGFDIDTWREDLSNHINLFQIAPEDNDPVPVIRNLIHYDFINENLLRQAFTRRAFQIEYGLSASSEELEFLGDTVLSTVLIREIFRQFSEVLSVDFCSPFHSRYNEGELTKLREHFISKEALAARARELDLGKYILYGTGETETDSSLEDMMEALIGAVVIDSNWNMEKIERAVNELLLIQLDTPDRFLKKSYYDILNAWHQKHFGCIPTYEVHQNTDKKSYPYWCDIRFRVPANENNIYTSQRLLDEGETRSKAREHAAKSAYRFIIENGLWKKLADAGVVPDIENSINQLQELYQKKYVDSKPEYEFEQREGIWKVFCNADSFCGSGTGKTKVRAKKKAAYMVIVQMLMSAGICKEEWKNTMYQNLRNKD